MKNIVNIIFSQNVNGKEVLCEESKEIELDILKYDDEERVYIIQGVEDRNIYDFLNELDVYPVEKVNYDTYLKPIYLTKEFEKGGDIETLLHGIEIYTEEGELIDNLLGKLKYCEY